ncbi:MAG: TCAD7 domain-containing protein, partial [Chloroflexota bacterium]
MPLLSEVVSEDFIVLPSTLTAGELRELLGYINTDYVVIHRAEKQEYYYLFTKKEALQILQGLPEPMLLLVALNLHEYTSSPVLDASADAEVAPDRCVVLQDGRAVGVFDAAAFPTTRSTRFSWPSFGEPETSERLLIAEFPQEVRINEVVSLLVSIRIEEPHEAFSTSIGRLAAGTVVDIVVTPQSGFVFENNSRSEGSFTVDDNDQNLVLQFKLKAVQLGTGKIRVLALLGGQSIGQPLIVTAKVVENAVAITNQRIEQQQPLISVRSSEPDLSLFILETRNQGQYELSFYVSSPDRALNLQNKPYPPPIPLLPTNPTEFMRDFYKDIEQLPLRTTQ